MSKRKPIISEYFEYIIKENGKKQSYNSEKGRDALIKVMDQNNCIDPSLATKLTKQIEKHLNENKKSEYPTTKEWADSAYKILKEKGKKDLAESYIENRKQKVKNRLRNSPLMTSFEDILKSSGDDPNSILSENANISGWDPAAQLHRIASESNKNFVLDYLLPSQYAKAHREKWIHIHDLDYFELNYNCLQFDLIAALNDGFDTGKGLNSEPHSIQTAAALAAILLQSSTNQQHGGIAILNFDFALGKYVNISFRKEFKKVVEDYYKISSQDLPFYFNKDLLKKIYYGISENEVKEIIFGDDKFNSKIFSQVMKFIEIASDETKKDTTQAMQGFCHNMNTLHSRAANQVPFSSINFGLDTSEAGRLVSKSLLNCTIKGSGNGETFIYPISIMHILTGINYLPGDPNYDIYKLAIKCSAKRLYPNFNFVDSPYQFKYLRNKQGKLLWKMRENYYIEKSLVSKEDLDNLPEQDEYVHSNQMDRIRLVSKIDFDLRRKHKECFNILEFFQGTENEKKVLKAESVGVQFPALYDKLSIGFDDRTTPARMGCRTYVEGDNLVEFDTNHEPSKYKFVRTHRPPYEITAGRGNFNFITLNLPKFAIESVLNTKNAKMRKKNDLIVQNEMLSKFFKYILDYSVKAKNILQIKEEIIGNKLGKNFQFVIGQNIIIGSDEIEENDQTHKIWEHFSKSIGYIGLYEAMLLLYNKDHSIDKEHGEEIVRFIRKFTDNLSKGFYILPTEKGSREPEWWKKINNYNESTYSNKNKEKSYWDECFQVYDMTNNEPIYLADCEWE